MNKKLGKINLLQVFSTITIVLIILIVVEIAVLIYKKKDTSIQATQGNQEATNNPNPVSPSSNFKDIKNCLNEPWEEQNACFDNFIGSYAGDKTIKQLLAELQTAREADPSVENSCHPMSHAIGRLSYKQNGNVGDAFEACDYTCHSGCYHGVMERLFYSDEQIAAGIQHLSVKELQSKMPGICDADKFSNPTNSIIFQCLHGVGHAALFTLDYDLEGALQVCKKLGNNYERSSCYGGVFMENVTAFNRDKRDINYEDPHYPCNKVDKEFRGQCYLMQTSIMTEAGLSSSRIAEECAKAGEFASECFNSVGRDLSNHVRLGTGKELVDICEPLSHDYSRNCFAGAIYALIDNTWNAEYSHKLCDIINKSDMRKECYQIANTYLKNNYNLESTEIREMCELYSDNKSLCISQIN